MALRLSELRWGRIILVALGVILASYLAALLVVTIYAFKLAFEVLGSPDQARIGKFAGQVSPWITQVLTVILTFVAAWWMGRKHKAATTMHGFITGIMVSLLGISMSIPFGGSVGSADVLWCAMVIASGWAGGKLVNAL